MKLRAFLILNQHFILETEKIPSSTTSALSKPNKDKKKFIIAN